MVVPDRGQPTTKIGRSMVIITKGNFSN